MSSLVINCDPSFDFTPTLESIVFNHIFSFQDIENIVFKLQVYDYIYLYNFSVLYIDKYRSEREIATADTIEDAIFTAVKNEARDMFFALFVNAEVAAQTGREDLPLEMDTEDNGLVGCLKNKTTVMFTPAEYDRFLNFMENDYLKVFEKMDLIIPSEQLNFVTAEDITSLIMEKEVLNII